MSDCSNSPMDNPEQAGRDSAPARKAENAVGRPAERRKRRRALISAPVRIRGVYSGSNGPDEISTTVDVSRNGFLFLAEHALFTHGMTVAVTFPYSKSPVALQAEQPGRVVRVSNLPDGRFAMAVALEPSRHESAARSSSREPAGISHASVNRNAASGERPVVLVVDADAEIRASLTKLLSSQNYEAIAVSSARKAHALLNQLLPALVIAEIEGEDLPGFDLCARIKSDARLKGVPVVLTTRSAYPSDYANAHSLGAIVCIAKPFRPERVGHVVRLLAPTGNSGAQPASPKGPDGTASGGKSPGDPSFHLQR